MAVSFHPLSELFPLMEGAEFNALVFDIKENGLREPIVLLDEKILDGRNRYRACEVASVEPKFQQWENGHDPRAFVVSKNLHRRHLNESQRAMVAARLATRTRQDTLRPGGPHAPEVQIPTSSMSAAQAAELLNISRHLVFEAKTVLAKGTEEEIGEVQKGHGSVSTIGRQIRAKSSPKARAKKRQEPRSQAGKNPERIQRQQLNAEIWGRIRDSLTHLTSLPLAFEAVAIARVNDKTGLVDARLSKAITWLKDFSDAWHNDQSPN